MMSLKFDPRSDSDKLFCKCRGNERGMSMSASLNLLKNAVILTENDGVPGAKFHKSPENDSVEQLKRWLKCRGIKVSGKRDELIARVRDCVNSRNHHVLDPSIDGGKWIDNKQQSNGHKIDKTNSGKSSQVPDIPTSGWKSWPSYDIPAQFNYGHVYFYALELLPSNTSNVINENTSDESENEDEGLGHMTYKPFKNGQKYLDSGFVHDVSDNKTVKNYFIQAHVWPSMKNQLPHNVLVILSVHSGAVIYASCEPCKADALGRCSHIVAVLLMLLDHIKEHGPIVSTPCTGKDCTWNKGKKRQKNPQRLSSAQYPTKRRKSSLNVIDFDPRPPQHREVKTLCINEFVKDLQMDCANTGKLPMWLTQLRIVYADYLLSDICLPLLREKIGILTKNITPPLLMQIVDTEKQSQSEKWQCERWFRLTASKCLEAYRIGRLVGDGSNNAANRCKTFIESNTWNMYDENFQSVWMARGLENEAEAIAKYQEQTNHLVLASGLWVNPKFPWLACSPDGLVGSDGLIEIKCLKIFHEHSIQTVIEQADDFKDAVKRQCFHIEGNKCKLKHTHGYYYQVQMQLLVTGRRYCDFVLFSKHGPVSIERMSRDEKLISDILRALTVLWMNVIAPEVFEMRVPRDLLPVILPLEKNNPTTYTSLSNPNATSTSHQSNGSTSYPTTTGSTSYPTTTGSTSYPTTIGSSSYPTTTGSTSYPTTIGSTSYPTTTGSTSYPTTIGSTSYPTTTGSTSYPTTTNCGTGNATTLSNFNFNINALSNFVVLPWGCTASNGLKLTNTCPLDNWMMIFQSLVKSHMLNLDDLGESGKLIKTSLCLLDSHQYGDAKLALIPQTLHLANRSGIINLYGNEADYFLPLTKTILATKVTSTCVFTSCPLHFAFLSNMQYYS